MTISTVEGHSMAIKADGSLWTWGSNSSGQLGDGTTTSRLAPVKVMDGVISVSAGANNLSLAIKSDGSLWAWGFNNNGQLGDGTTVAKTTPVKIMDAVAFVSAGASGYGSVMAIKTDGSLWAWGRNSSGVLGDGTTENRLLPVKIMDEVASVSHSSSHTMAIKTDGTLWAWGNNNSGQLGDGTTETRTTPVNVMDGVTSVSARAACTMVIKTDGSLWACGSNYNGQVGDGTTTDRHTPVKVMDGAQSVSIGHNHVLAVKTDGSLWAWGDNVFGQLGDGKSTKYEFIYDKDEPKLIVDEIIIENNNKLSPSKVMDGVCAVSAGAFFSMAVKTDGSLWTCWRNRYGQLGDGTTADRISPLKIMDGVKIPIMAGLISTTGPEITLLGTPTASTVLVNGEKVAFDAYNINGNNYFKLRDLAFVLSGTDKQFEVGWDSSANAISLTSSEVYTPVGGEMAAKGAGNKTPTPTGSKIFLDGKEVVLTAYNIDGYNYFKLRDVGQAFDFGVDWDSANSTIVIDTSKGYTPE
jgi:alpha-tubulin suppressor-like RCC1 family protein